MKYIAALFLLSVALFANGQKFEQRTKYFPQKVVDAKKLPAKHNFWLFVLAGQSNMAGRALVEAEDTISNNRILTLDKNKHWVIAKEPLHFYEPKMTGLDCGLSFARKLVENLPDSVTIGLLPCAVGGSSIEQWLNDDEHRGVYLFSNLQNTVSRGKDVGVIKAVLWHQGESDAYSKSLVNYKNNLEKLIVEIQKAVGTDTLPMLIGELGAYAVSQEKQHRWDKLNTIINTVAGEEQNILTIDTHDLTSIGDHTHFNSKSQRIMGQRFADSFIGMLNFHDER